MRTFEDSGDGLMTKYRKVLNGTKNVISTHRGFRTKNHCVATYEQIKKGLYYFYPKWIVESDGIPTLQLKVYIHFLRDTCSNLYSRNFFKKTLNQYFYIELSIKLSAPLIKFPQL